MAVKNRYVDMKKSQLWMILLIASALLGTVISGLMIEHHSSAGKSLAGMICGEGEASGCNVVNKSAFSELFALPTALYGFILYGFIFVASVFYFLQEEVILLQLSLYGAIVALVADLFLAAYAYGVLKVFCLLCNLSYLSTLLIFFPAYKIFRDLKKEQKVGWKIQFFSWQMRKPVPLTLLIVAFLLVPVSGSYIFARTSSATSDKAQTSGDTNQLLRKAFDEIYTQYRSEPEINLDLSVLESEGTANPVLTIVEFADPLCPFCAHMTLRLHAFAEKHPDTVRLYYAHFPLDKNCNPMMQRQLHEGACELSYAAHCAGVQGKFFPALSRIYIEQNYWHGNVSGTSLQKVIGDNGLNSAKFQTCLKSSSTRRAIARAISEGAKVPVQGTPTLVVNGRRFPGVHYEFIDYVLEEMLRMENGQ